MKRKLLLSTVAVLLVVSIAIVGCAQPAPAPSPAPAPAPAPAPGEVYKWRMQQFIFSPNPLYIQDAAGWKQIEEETNGQLLITQYPANALIPTAEIPHAVAKGTIEMALSSSYAMFAEVPVMKMAYYQPGFLFSIPEHMFMFSAYGLLEVVQKEVMKAYNAYYFPQATIGSIIHSNKPIRGLADWKGLKIRATGSVGEWLKAMGAGVTNTPGEDLYVALQTGVIDGCFWGLYVGSGVELKLWEVTKYTLLPPVGIGIANNYLVNKDAFDELPPNCQSALKSYLEKRYWECLVGNWEGQMEGKKGFLEHGQEIINVPVEEQLKMRKFALEVIKEAAVDEPSKKAYDAIMKFVETNEFLWK